MDNLTYWIQVLHTTCDVHMRVIAASTLRSLEPWAHAAYKGPTMTLSLPNDQHVEFTLSNSVNSVQRFLSTKVDEHRTVGDLIQIQNDKTFSRLAYQGRVVLQMREEEIVPEPSSSQLGALCEMHCKDVEQAVAAWQQVRIINTGHT